VYVKLGLVLFALEVRSPSTGRVRIAVNPSGFVIPDPHLYHVHGYVIAENAEDAQRVARVNILAMRSIEVRVPGGGGGLTQCRVVGEVLCSKCCVMPVPKETRAHVYTHEAHIVWSLTCPAIRLPKHTRAHTCSMPVMGS
jgi:hypothetical protein